MEENLLVTQLGWIAQPPNYLRYSSWQAWDVTRRRFNIVPDIKNHSYLFKSNPKYHSKKVSAFFLLPFCVLSKFESVKFLLIKLVIRLFTDSPVEKYFSLLNQLIFTD